jgi:hypothetical protein
MAPTGHALDSQPHAVRRVPCGDGTHRRAIRRRGRPDLRANSHPRRRVDHAGRRQPRPLRQPRGLRGLHQRPGLPANQAPARPVRRPAELRRPAHDGQPTPPDAQQLYAIEVIRLPDGHPHRAQGAAPATVEYVLDIRSNDHRFDLVKISSFPSTAQRAAYEDTLPHTGLIRVEATVRWPVAGRRRARGRRPRPPR